MLHFLFPLTQVMQRTKNNYIAAGQHKEPRYKTAKYITEA